MFYKSINIQNFRSIAALEIKDLRQVNILTGRNNCGKSTVLEAVFLLTGMSNAKIPVNIHAFRDIFLTDDDDFNFLFRDLNFANGPAISGELNLQKRELRIAPIYPGAGELSSEVNQTSESARDKPSSDIYSSTGAEVEGLRLNFSIDDGPPHSTEIRIKQNKLKPPADYKEKISANFINHHTIMGDITPRLDAILVRKNLHVIINALKEIEPGLVDIRMGANAMVYADIGLEKLIPVNMLGDGIRRFLSILAAISEKKNDILLIDEVENGLHHKTLAMLWKIILKAAVDNNVQLFLTTHSYECIEALAETYSRKKSEMDKHLFSLFRIDKNEAGAHRAFQYDPETLAAGVDKRFEVR